MRSRSGHGPIVVDFLDRVCLRAEQTADLAHGGFERGDKMWRPSSHIGYVGEVAEWRASRRHDTWDEAAHVMHEHCRAWANGFEGRRLKSPITGRQTSAYCQTT